MRTHAAPIPARAFSLVEVLVAVLVLALGLLGLGAVFPMVVRQQRIATQTTLGLSAMEAVQRILVNNSNFASDGPGWQALRTYVVNSGGKDGDWVPVVPHPATGNYTLAPNVVLPLSQRLYPLPFSSQSDPRFVWDIAARIADPRDPASPMIVAVFLRPIDPGIRPGRYRDGEVMVPYSLTNTLLGGVPSQDRRNPVSVDEDGRPTLDGRRDGGARYATPVVAEVTGPGTDPIRRELHLQRVLTSGTDVAVANGLLAAPGQKFVDRSGNVYTVSSVRSLGGGAQAIHFQPAVVEVDVDGDGRFDDDDFNPIIFTPQAAVIEPWLFTVTP